MLWPPWGVGYATPGTSERKGCGEKFSPQPFLLLWNQAAKCPLHGRNSEKNPLIGRPPCICFSSPEIVTKVCCEAVTNPDNVAVPVVGSTDANWVTLGTKVRGGGPLRRLNVRFAEETGLNDATMK